MRLWGGCAEAAMRATREGGRKGGSEGGWLVGWVGVSFMPHTSTRLAGLPSSFFRVLGIDVCFRSLHAVV